ncbi:MAG: HEPN domain-containing protein [Thermoplasmata archaeon]
MNLVPGAESFLRRASTRLDTAERMLAEGNLPEVVRFSQEATEHSLKAALRLFEVEYPKRHDPAEALKAGRSKFPRWFQVEIPRMAALSAILSANRELAVYGDERIGKTADDLFSDKAQAAVWSADARRVYRLCLRLSRATQSQRKVTSPSSNPKGRKLKAGLA